MRVELLTVGDELLLGDTVNGNAAWLGRRLADHGVEVTRSVVVGDELDVIVEAVASALGRADAVITTGGLGPTYDDVTRDALAKAAGVGLVRDPALERRLRERAEASGRVLQPMAFRMAEVPEGAGLLRNSAGTAPGLRVELPGGIAYALPGVPFEMRTIMDEVVLPELAAIAGPPGVARRTLRTARVWESVLATRLAEVEAMDGVRLAYLPDPAEVKIRVTAAGPDAPGRLAAAEARVRELLGDVVYGVEDETLARVVHRLLVERSATVAAAESLTGGLISAELTAAPGSSETYAGGIVAYATEMKARLLGVPDALLAEHGAVHPDVAAAMAAGVRDRLGTAYGLSVTGVAGPEPQDGRPVGTVYIGLAGPEGTRTVVSPKLPVPGKGPEIRAVIQRMTVVHALELLRRALLGLDVAEWSEESRRDREEWG
ncbi:CinA family nicotinamide mononucleotide deamidase-related protein [Actinomadura sp. NEAU-AAG7]|uniref:CinA family nicotinamide mononucleotide deamidase-related protein n=1 Tax=Actinomadura sp. NEAU-AAG7 TaxID=2839640 RepID=UPI001BE3F9FB|nr:CinA family nicotinamide mononucleotide deamidase-related protein [Actinomadura sp. NEAU-AAG7]MBT2209389.1 CinA family nicotinamide mononucleotide deamidase-related protein [Actinomadura sp. NEAU-AAG7]